MKGLDVLKKQYWTDDWDEGTQAKLENKDRTLVAISSDQVGDGTGLISAVMHYLTSILPELQRTYSASSDSAIVEYVDEGWIICSLGLCVGTIRGACQINSPLRSFEYYGTFDDETKFGMYVQVVNQSLKNKHKKKSSTSISHRGSIDNKAYEIICINFDKFLIVEKQCQKGRIDEEQEM
ncbi:hypothetical protein V1478_006464 [Vespula squamosa]|uniref:Uncharacterized protein n=1 Tax=Vespula squamosa TaxID=30214 RepID=A0ABD2B7X5_VESSQ